MHTSSAIPSLNGPWTCTVFLLTNLGPPLSSPYTGTVLTGGQAVTCPPPPKELWVLPSVLGDKADFHSWIPSLCLGQWDADLAHVQPRVHQSSSGLFAMSHDSQAQKQQCQAPCTWVGQSLKFSDS